MQRCDKEYVHGQLAVEAARIKGIFPNIDAIWKVDSTEEDTVKIAGEDVDNTINKWQTQLEQSSLVNDDINLETNTRVKNIEAGVMPIFQLLNHSNHDNVMDKTISTSLFDVENLNDDQRRAYNILDWHLNKTNNGNPPPPPPVIDVHSWRRRSQKIKSYSNDDTKLSKAWIRRLVGERSVYWNSGVVDRWEKFACFSGYSNQREAVSADFEKNP